VERSLKPGNDAPQLPEAAPPGSEAPLRHTAGTRSRRFPTRDGSGIPQLLNFCSGGKRQSLVAGLVAGFSG